MLQIFKNHVARREVKFGDVTSSPARSGPGVCPAPTSASQGGAKVKPMSWGPVTATFPPGSEFPRSLCFLSGKLRLTE